ncbi:MAG: tryptophan 2,3-dioxygenase family protein [Bacteroidota bacterium]
MEEEIKKYKRVHYQNYLQLDKLLDAQHPRSGALEEEEAHDEMLFIIVHQSYEVWFKQIIHELESVIDMFDDQVVDESNIDISIARLQRVTKILRLLIEHIQIMETMTPLDFLDFRNYLFPASGFQSFQFRKIENLLGLPDSERLTYGGHSYGAFFSEEEQAELTRIDQGANLFAAVEDWLERTPFLHLGDFEFLELYKAAVERMVAKERNAILESDYISEKEKAGRIKMMGSTDTYFESILNREVHARMVKAGKQRLNYDATLAALMINLYNEEPLLQLPYRFLLCLVDIDEMLTTWRYRHAQMVLRMLGRKIGTGGSSGYDYLHATAVKHHIFKDLHNISTLLIPRSELPELPPNINKQLGFYYTNQNT